MTWREIKLATLQKLFSADGDSVAEDESNRDYLAAMPQAANEAMALLACENCCIRNCVTVTVFLQQGDLRTRLDMKELAPDFQRFGEREVYQKSLDAVRPVEDFAVLGDRFLLVPQTWCGEYEVWYDALPPRITAQTPDDTVLPLDDDAAVILPLYMASQLYKDDDSSAAAIYRNEFEVARAALRKPQPGLIGGEWRSCDGW